MELSIKGIDKMPQNTNSNWNFFNPETWSQNWSTENWTESQKQTMENARTANEALMSSLNKLAQRQNEMMQSMMQQNIEAAKEISSATGIESMMNAQTQYSRTAMETATKNAQELTEMYRQCGTECSEIYQNAAQQTMTAWTNANTTQTSTKTTTSSKK